MDKMPLSKPIQLTTLGYAILGLLQQESMTGYRVRMIFETTPMGHYSGSPGTIYPALHRLNRSGMIEKISTKNRKGKVKKVFRITPTGRKALKTWLQQPVEQEDVIKGLPELLLKFAFMEKVLTMKDRIRFLSSFRREIDQYVELLQNYRQKEFEPEQVHAWLSLENGIEVFKAHSRWAARALETLKRLDEKSDQSKRRRKI